MSFPLVEHFEAFTLVRTKFFASTNQNRNFILNVISTGYIQFAIAIEIRNCYSLLEDQKFNPRFL